ncbi:MAG: hypothetical protein R3234_09175, partial [Thermoanaerobaculia bacterium]|nr:hypothetical protein [Thermoanaerobaculia bacterium]
YNDGRRLWIAAGDGTDPRPLESFDPLFFGYFARPDFSPDGKFLVSFWPHPARPLGDLWIAPVDGGEPRQLTDLGFLSWGTAPVWSADGRWILFTSDHGGSVNLWRVAGDGGDPEPVTFGAGSDYSPDLSRDLRRLIYANGRNTARIRVFDPETGETRTAHHRRNQAITPRVSPEGDRVAYFTRADGGFHLFVADLETGEARQVTHGEGAINTHPFWSADGESLYYYRQEPYTFRRISVDGRRDETILEDWRWPTENRTHPSPDETRLVYTVREAGRNVEARVRDLATGEEHPLPRPLYDPLWTPDGQEIYGATFDPYRIHLCAADGSSCREVTGGWDARVSADGESLYVLRGSPPVAWRHDLGTGDDERLVTMEPYDATDFDWGVTPEGEIVFHTQQRGDRELWLGEAASRP